MNTRLVRNRTAIRILERELKRPLVEYVDDAPYRDGAINEAIRSSLDHNRALSLVDVVIRAVLDDVDYRINYLFTSNESDFADLCAKRKIEIL